MQLSTCFAKTNVQPDGLHFLKTAVLAVIGLCIVAVQALGYRHMQSTKMNAQSSRSHAVFVFKLGSALLFVIDAGGTERIAKSEAEGQQ